MRKLLSLLILIFLAANGAQAAFPITQKHAANTTAVLPKAHDQPAGITALKKATSLPPAVAPEEINVDEGLSAESIISLVLPLATLAFFIIYTPLAAPVIALISGVVGITSILLADHVISTEKTGRGLAMAGYVLGTVGASVAAGIGFYYLLAAIF